MAKRQLSVLQVSGTAPASGFPAAWEPVASAIPLSYFFADAYLRSLTDGR
jgi:hypothetical protein